MDLAEMMMFFEFMMGGGRGGSNGRAGGGARGGARPSAGFVDVDMMFDFAFGGARRGGGASTGAPAHWGAMDDDDDYDDYDDEGDSGSDAASDRASGAKRISLPPFKTRDEALKLTVGELKALLRERDVDFSGCLEKSEMLGLLLDWEAARGLFDDDDAKPSDESAAASKAKRAARKKAQQKRKKERQKAERNEKELEGRGTIHKDVAKEADVDRKEALLAQLKALHNVEKEERDEVVALLNQAKASNPEENADEPDIGKYYLRELVDRAREVLLTWLLTGSEAAFQEF